MKEKVLLIFTLALVVSGCGKVELEGEVLDPAEVVDPQAVVTAVPTELPDPGDKDVEPPVVIGVLPAPVIYLQAEDQAVAPGQQNIWRLEVDGITATRKMTLLR